MTYTPSSLAARWDSTSESVIALIRAQRLAAFTLSAPGSKRPRWRITQESVEAFERGQQPQPAALPATKQRRRARPRVAFY